MSQKNSSPSVRDRARGMLVGLAVGDALGAPVEFGYTSQSIAALGDKIEHFQSSPLGPAGTWTDDTSMALCLADSLIEKNGYDSFDIMGKYRHWMLDGYRTCDGLPAADVVLEPVCPPLRGLPAVYPGGAHHGRPQWPLSYLPQCRTPILLHQKSET